MIRMTALFAAILCASPVAGTAQALDSQLRELTGASQDLSPLCRFGEMPDAADMAPVRALKSTKGYGSDQATQKFAWGIMVLGARALDGQETARADLIQLLTEWEEAEGLTRTIRKHDAVYALKRTLLPLIMSYGIVRDDLNSETRRKMDKWIASLVRTATVELGGDVDHNNHRYLADSVLAAWGAVSGDAALLDQAESRVITAFVKQLRADGSWPLETRRGARALWYTRQSLASLTFILSVLEAQGRDPLAQDDLRDGFERAMTYFMDGIHSPVIVTKYAVENYIPGPSDDYANQDMSFLAQRPHGRHYMAFMNTARTLVRDPVLAARIDRYLTSVPADELPMIDEFSGGNANCFWGLMP